MTACGVHCQLYARFSSTATVCFLSHRPHVGLFHITGLSVCVCDVAALGFHLLLFMCVVAIEEMWAWLKSVCACVRVCSVVVTDGH